MLEPRDRLLLFEALQPPGGLPLRSGHRHDLHPGLVGTPDGPARVHAGSNSRTRRERSCRRQLARDSREPSPSCRRLTLFCHAGRIGAPKAALSPTGLHRRVHRRVRARSEAAHSIRRCGCSDGSNDAGGVRYRVLCLSRNLAFSRAWDTLLTLDGPLAPDRAVRHRPKPSAGGVRAGPSGLRDDGSQWVSRSRGGCSSSRPSLNEPSWNCRTA